MKEEEEKKRGESLTDYATRMIALKDTNQLRVPEGFVDDEGNVIVQPVLAYSFNEEGTPVRALDEDHAFISKAATVATEATLQPTSPKIFYLYGIWVAAGTLAANRDFQPMITDGTNEMPLCSALSVADGTTVQLWPEKAADNERVCTAPFPISNAYYLQIQDAMTAAETATIWISYVHRSSEL